MQKNSNEKNVMHFCHALNCLNENCLLKNPPVYDSTAQVFEGVLAPLLKAKILLLQRNISLPLRSPIQKFFRALGVTPHDAG